MHQRHGQAGPQWPSFLGSHAIFLLVFATVTAKRSLSMGCEMDNEGVGASRGPRLDFEQMCTYMAVAKTGRPRDTIKGLVKLCLVQLEDPLANTAQVSEALSALYGIRVPPREIEHAIDELVGSGAVLRPKTGPLVVDPGVRAEVLARLDEARSTEESIKSEWLREASLQYPDLPADALWAGLRAYLAKAFRRHGLQTAALLDQRVLQDRAHAESLSSILEGVLRDFFDAKHRSAARAALSSFMASVGANADRARYIAQLADGAFNFYSLEVDPAVASNFRKKLKELTVFLDTNFLFGFLDLSHNSQVELSKELIRATAQHHLPFRLRFHEATQREMHNTIIHYGSRLKSRHWTQAVSKAAASSRYISGIEQKYHERNAVATLSPTDFLMPYDHLDVWLKDKGIEIYRPHDTRIKERTDVFEEYKEFLSAKGHEDKAYETVYHDATVLDAVRQLRTKAESSLDAGAIILSVDYWLYRFDWETAKKSGRLACVLLPNNLWQILRPFIPSDSDFEKSFARNVST